MTRVWAGTSGVRISVGGQRFLSCPKRPDRLRAPTSLLLFAGCRGSSPWLNRPVCEFNLSPPSKAEDKNGWSRTSTSVICIHGVDRGEKLTLYIYCLLQFYQIANTNQRGTHLCIENIFNICYMFRPSRLSLGTQSNTILFHFMCL